MRAALYLRSQGVANAEILRLCGMSKASFHRHLKAYMAGGITQLKRIDHYRPHSELANHRTTLEAYFHQHPPATVAEAAAKIAELTGIVRKPTAGMVAKSAGDEADESRHAPGQGRREAQEAIKKKPGAQVTGR